MGHQRYEVDVLLFLPFILIAGLVAGRANGAVWIGAVAVGVGIALAGIAVGTGNWLLYYGGSALVPFGLLTLVVRWFVRPRRDARGRP